MSPELCSDNEVIPARFLSGGQDRVRGDLSRAFNSVADKSNWKNPINIVVDLDDHTKQLVAEAVTFYTGSVATFARLTGTTTGGVARYRVQAVGYYEAIGA